MGGWHSLWSSTSIFLRIQVTRSVPVKTEGILVRKLLTVRTGTPMFSSCIRSMILSIFLYTMWWGVWSRLGGGAEDLAATSVEEELF